MARGFFPLDLLLHSVFWEHHRTVRHKSHGKIMRVHLLSRNRLCPWLPSKTSLPKRWKCKAGSRWKVRPLLSWEWGEESKQARQPVALTCLQPTDGQISSKYNSTGEEDPEPCFKMHRENQPLSSLKKNQTLSIFWHKTKYNKIKWNKIKYFKENRRSECLPTTPPFPPHHPWKHRLLITL